MRKYNVNFDTYESRNSAITWDYGKFVHKDIVPNVNVEIGRSDLRLGQGLVADTTGGYDSIRVTYAKDNFQAFYAYGDIAAATKAPFIWDEWEPNAGANISVLNLSWNFNENWNITGAAIHSHSHPYPYNIYSIGIKGRLQDYTWTAEMAKNTNNYIFPDKDTSAWMTSLWYKGAQKNIKGSWGVYVDYRNVGSGAIDGRLSTLNGLEQIWSANQNMPNGYWRQGVQGIGYGFNYTVAKNAVFTATIEQLKAKEQAGKKFGTLVYLRMEYSF
jgi:hypothetical protein